MSGMTPRKMTIYGVLVAASLALAIFGQPSSDTSAAATDAPRTDRGAPERRTPAARSTLSADAAALLTRLAHRGASSTASRELFAAHSWYVPPPPPPPPPPAPPVAPPKPTPPPLPFVFLGSYAAQGDAATYFVSRGDRIYDIKLGDSIDAEYSLDSLDGSNLVFTYKPLNAHQSLPVGGYP
jgi:hypothetical protein